MWRPAGQMGLFLAVYFLGLCAALLIFAGMSLFTGPLPIGSWLKGTPETVGIRWCALPIIALAALLLKKSKIPFPLILIICAFCGAFLLK